MRICPDSEKVHPVVCMGHQLLYLRSNDVPLPLPNIFLCIMKERRVLEEEMGNSGSSAFLSLREKS